MVAESLTATRDGMKKGAVSLQDDKVFVVGEIQHLVAVILAKGHSLIGPTVRDGAIVYAPIQSADDLPSV